MKLKTILVQLHILDCSDDSGCDITRDAGPNCDVNRRECFYCLNDVNCLNHRNKRCGSDGRCIEGENRGTMRAADVNPTSDGACACGFSQISCIGGV